MTLARERKRRGLIARLVVDLSPAPPMPSCCTDCWSLPRDGFNRCLGDCRCHAQSTPEDRARLAAAAARGDA
jgi:hypothetical protein